ncbi:DUF4012 domain-containing protein [Microbacterium azadirachtae]|uniref:DUF4012 domain-containing protein n=1 Tax=Microbacterium azadirachtae TaxID=582680 RepID=UPI000883B939|nr:DUF4012 domain-containing protein [Microbacterium azadirachtae]SDM43317.1 Protein of unknown function [Microbacterium azadirachtae]SEG57174.1 Protein of unknown function [Microbacterium azadirachtae]SEG60123.1 Protein of unknown function [Microbacterium azadirachtae]
MLKSPWFWVPISLLVVLIVIGVVGALTAKRLYDQAMIARNDLEQAIPLVDQVQQSMLAGDPAGAKKTIAKISALTDDAAKKTSTGLWRNSEWVPVAGPNLKAVRITADSVNGLVHDALLPLTGLDLKALLPKDGGIDVANLKTLADDIDTANTRMELVQKNVKSIDRSALVPQVAAGLAKLDDAIAKIEPVLTPVHNALTILPNALGADGPQHYLLIFQNNAESRGTGGNPAAIAMLTAVNGKISMTQQANSTDFANGRPEPVMALDPETEALYGDKIGRYIQDSTLSPDFSETAQIVRAWWSETYGTPVDAVASIDPVALGYLLHAIGPVTMPAPFDETLNANNAVALLLNGVYAKYPDPHVQDEFFADAAKSVFDALLTTHADPKALLTALTQASNEGRLMYSPSDEAQAKMLAGTPVGGNMPADNAKTTDLGVYIDDLTASKLDYYMQMSIAASGTQCQKPDAPTFSSTVTLQNTLDPAAVPGLPVYVDPGLFFPKGHASTDVYLYGPVGSTLTGVTVDGQPVAASGLPHLGRTVAKLNVLMAPGQTTTIVASFSAPSGAYGPLEVRHTPMVKATPVAIDAPGCTPAKK